jgi:pimeloyl-ACP methyl ester carboxylesterase
MKTTILTLVLLVSSLFIHAQNSQLQNLDINLSNIDYPYEVHFLKLQIQNHNLQMAYMDVRSSTPNLKNIVLLHGKNFNGAYWETTIRELVSKGYRVIVPDQVGFGKSSKPFHIQYSFQQLALNTKALLDSLGIRRTAVLGHSMGGMLATRFALMFPEITEKLICEEVHGETQDAEERDEPPARKAIARQQD